MLTKRFSAVCVVILMLMALPQAVNAQFYQRKDSAVRMLLRGVDVERKDTVDKSTRKRTVKKKKPSKGNGVTAKKVAKSKSSDTVKVKKTKKQDVLFESKKYRLGERVIMRGDSGTDVRSLANLLVKKLFLDERDIIYAADGTVKYDGEIIRAVRSFQKVAGLYEDGMVGATTVRALRKRK